MSDGSLSSVESDRSFSLQASVRPSTSWVVITTAVLGFVGVAVIASRMTPPAVTIAEDDFTVAAILATAGVLVWAWAAERFDRQKQLATFVMLLVAWGGWESGRQWVHGRQFEYLASRQRQQLRWSAIQLSGNIINFLRDRSLSVPPQPSPATWDEDSRAIRRFERETARLYEARFGREVRMTHDLLAVRGLRDRELDVFFRRPGDAFQISTVATRMAALAKKLRP